MASILTEVQQNQVKRLNLTSTSLGRFYELASSLKGHKDSVYCLAFFKNSILASGSADNIIKLWDLVSYSCLYTLRGHTSSIHALAILPNGQLASSSCDRTIELWDLASRSCLPTLQGHSYSVWALAILPNGQLASGCWNETINSGSLRRFQPNS